MSVSGHGPITRKPILDRWFLATSFLERHGTTEKGGVTRLKVLVFVAAICMGGAAVFCPFASSVTAAEWYTPELRAYSIIACFVFLFGVLISLAWLLPSHYWFSIEWDADRFKYGPMFRRPIEIRWEHRDEIQWSANPPLADPTTDVYEVTLGRTGSSATIAMSRTSAMFVLEAIVERTGGSKTGVG
jgi:hypothetical protein